MAPHRLLFCFTDSYSSWGEEIASAGPVLRSFSKGGEVGWLLLEIEIEDS